MSTTTPNAHKAKPELTPRITLSRITARLTNPIARGILAAGLIAVAASPVLAGNQANATNNGSTIQILAKTTATGVPVATGLLGDSNPYGVNIVPKHFNGGHNSLLHSGDVLVSNYNNTTLVAGNQVSTQGLGTTITLIKPNGTASLFFHSTTAGVTGFSNALDILPNGIVLAGTVPTTDGTSATVHGGPILVISGQGTLLTKIPASSGAGPGNFGPWGSTINVEKNGAIEYFVANCLAPGATLGTFQGTIVRYNITFNHKGVMTIGTPVQIASGYIGGPNPAAIVLGPAGLAYDSHSGTLYVAGEGNDAIYAVANAATTATDGGTGTVVYADPTHLFGPLGLVLAPNGDLLTANADSINPQATFASQIVEFTPKAGSIANGAGAFVMNLQVDPANGGAFGLRLQENNGIAKLLAVDDNAVDLQAYNFALEQNPF